MSAIAAEQPLLQTETVLRSRWFAFVALGLAFVLLGMAASLNLFFATVAATYYLGALILVGAVLQLVHAFSVRSWGRILFWALGGILYLAAGSFVFFNPLFAAIFLTLAIALALGFSGIMRLGAALGTHVEGRGWIIASGLASIAAALIIGIGWPLNSLWMLGLILAIDLLFQGIALIFAGLSFRTGALA